MNIYVFLKKITYGMIFFANGSRLQEGKTIFGYRPYN